MVTSTTTTIGFLSRDPIGFKDGFLLYGNYLSQKFVDPYGLSYTDPAGRTCQIDQTCKLGIVAYHGTYLGGIEILIAINEPHWGNVGHTSLCWNCSKSNTQPGGPNWPNPDMPSKGCVGLYPDGLHFPKSEYPLMKNSCTHGKVFDVCPETLEKLDKEILESKDKLKQNKCRWVVQPDPQKPSQQNCTTWACNTLNATGIPFPTHIIDPYYLCNRWPVPGPGILPPRN